MDTLTLKKDSNGNIVRVESQVMVNEFVLDRDWLQQQITFHSDKVVEYQNQLAAYDDFVKSKETEVEVSLNVA